MSRQGEGPGLFCGGDGHGPGSANSLFPAPLSFGGGGEGGREGVLGGDLGQSSLPKPLPAWVLKGAAVFRAVPHPPPPSRSPGSQLVSVGIKWQ